MPASARPAARSTPRPIPSGLRDAVLTWYRARGRVLAFRATRDPYRILVSEVMAQQTQITRAEEAWSRFVAAFPTLRALADASPADVLREWRGLGYNRRAINLQRAARAVVADHDGELPRDVDALRTLPGVGPYTARALAAIAFDAPVGAVDTNVRRVLGRVVAGDPGALTPADLQRIADAAVPLDAPGEWTHALMDVGATFCRPATPRCEACPAAPWCRFAGTSGARSAATPRTARSLQHAPGPRRARPAEPPFTATSRWLRGRILDLLRDAPAGAWVTVPGSIGGHDGAAVSRALAALVADGLAERGTNDPSLARLPPG